MVEFAKRPEITIDTMVRVIVIALWILMFSDFGFWVIEWIGHVERYVKVVDWIEWIECQPRIQNSSRNSRNSGNGFVDGALYVHSHARCPPSHRGHLGSRNTHTHSLSQFKMLTFVFRAKSTIRLAKAYVPFRLR